MVDKGDCNILIKRFVIILLLLLLFPIVSQVSGEIPSHIDPGNVVRTDSNLKEQQSLIINELLSSWSGIFISLKKGDIKGALDNFEQYKDILQENNNVLIKIDGGAYEELKQNANTLNLTLDETEKLLALYEEGKIAYQSNQTQKAIQIAIEARYSIKNLNSFQEDLIMESVEQFPGINITEYRTGLLDYDVVLDNLSKRMKPIELTLFDDSITSLTVQPNESEFGQRIYLDGAVTMPRNRTGVQNATVVIRIDSSTHTTILTNKTGHYNYIYNIPYNKPGRYPINVEFVPFKEPLISSYNISYFAIIPTNTTLTLESKPDSGIFGDIITISGTLMAPNISAVPDANISISLDNQTISSVKTDNNGSYKYSHQIQGIPAGVHSLKADFIPDDQPLFSSGNNSTLTIIPTKTSIKISGPGTIHQNNFLNISWNVTTEKGFSVNDTDITVLLDDKKIGSAVINSGDFYFTYLIDRKIQKGKHNLTVKYNAISPFLSSEITNIIEILEPEFNNNILYLVGIIGIMISAFYMRKDRYLNDKIVSIISGLRTRIGHTTKSATKSETIPEPFDREEKIEEIIKKEPETIENFVRMKEKDKEPETQRKAFPEIEEFITQSKYGMSISLSYVTIKNMISEHLKIDHYKCLTHREFLSQVKDAIPAINDDMKEITDIYEHSMYSGIASGKNSAIKALELVKKISGKLNNEVQL